MFYLKRPLAITFRLALKSSSFLSSGTWGPFLSVIVKLLGRDANYLYPLCSNVKDSTLPSIQRLSGIVLIKYRDNYAFAYIERVRPVLGSH